MYDLEKYKKSCSNILEKVRKSYKIVANQLFQFDMDYLKKQYNERFVQDKCSWILDGKIIFRKRTGQYQEGSFEIEDRRGSAFLWGFEYEINGVSIGDAFIYNKTPYQVHLLTDIIDADMINQIEKTITILEETYDKLKFIQNNHYSEITFKYYDCHEEIYCNSIIEVVEEVLKRDFT